MRPISSKKILIILLVLSTMVLWDKVMAMGSATCRYFSDALEPLRDSPPQGRLVVAMLILALLYITIFKLLYNRNERR